MTTLPSGWVYSTLEQVCVYIQRGKSPKYALASDLPVVNQKCVRWNGIEEQHLKFVDPSQFSAWGPERHLRSGDILWNSTGTGTIGRASLFGGSRTYPRMVADSHVTVVRPSHQVEGRFIHALISSPLVQSKIEDMQSGSTNQVELSREQVLSTLVPLPPQEEQRRIVKKIDSLSAKSKRARSHLEHIPTLVRMYKDAILRAAFEGKLTYVYRNHNRIADSENSPIKTVREERYAIWEAAKKSSREPYVPPTPLASKEAPHPIPAGWSWAAAEEIVQPGSDIVYGIVQPGPKLEKGIPYVRGTDIENGVIKIDQLLFTSEEVAARYSRASLEGGDVLLGIIRATKVAIVPDELTGANITQGTARLRPSQAITTDFLARWLEGETAQRWLHSKYRGIDMPGLNLRDVRRCPVPIAPLAEQALIVDILNQAFHGLIVLPPTQPAPES